MFQAFVSISAIPLSETLKNNRATEVEYMPSVREGPKLKVSESAGPKLTEIYVSKRETFAAEVLFIWGGGSVSSCVYVCSAFSSVIVDLYIAFQKPGSLLLSLI